MMEHVRFYGRDGAPYQGTVRQAGVGVVGVRVGFEQDGDLVSRLVEEMPSQYDAVALGTCVTPADPGEVAKHIVIYAKRA